MRAKVLIVVVLVTFVAGCLSYLFEDEVGEKVKRDSGLKFSHAVHADMLSCLDCHGGAAKSALAGMPTKESCMECHEEADHSKKEGESCLMCHMQPIAGPVRSKPGVYADVIFNHAKHVKSEKDCASCHGDVAKAQTLTDMLLPAKEAVCLKCHQKDVGQADRCSICHKETRVGIKPTDHDKSWKRLHGEFACEGFFDKQWYKCSLCHEQNTCNACHQQEAPRGHNETWRRGTHGLSAEVDRQRCMVCHKQDACVRCHSTAPPYPRDPMHTGLTGCSESCHKKAHRFGGQQCTACHK
jgi:hypothetical protein